MERDGSEPSSQAQVEPPQDTASRERSFLHNRRVRAIIAEIVLAFVAFYLDPLGLAVQRSRAFDDITAVFAPYWYQMPPANKLAVVLVDEETLRSWHEDWPIPYGRTAEMIHALACVGAAGVFFDYTGSRQYNLAEGQDVLETEVADSSARIGPDCRGGQRPAKIPVFFGQVAGVDAPLANSLRTMQRTFWLDSGVNDGLYPAGRTMFPEHASGADRTPAFGLLAAVPSLAARSPPDDGSVCGENDGRVRCWTNPLRLVWSDGVDPAQAAVGSLSRCRGAISLLQTLMNIVGVGVYDRYEPCPPILTLRGDDLFRDAAFIGHNGDPTTVLAGRFVLVGTQLTGLNDQVYSPLHGYLPGVYKHAMALDNLITKGAAYETIPKPWILNIIVVLLYGVIELIREVTSELRRRELFFLAVVVGTAGAFASVTYLYHWPLSLLPAVFLYYAGALMFVRFGRPPHEAKVA